MARHLKIILSSKTTSRKKIQNIPLVTVLRKRLGYGESGQPRDKNFKREVKRYASTYQTDRGVPGSQLCDWRSNHLEIKRMTDRFLDRDGNGVRYWPDEAGDTDPDRLRWSRDSGQ